MSLMMGIPNPTPEQIIEEERRREEESAWVHTQIPWQRLSDRNTPFPPEESWKTWWFRLEKPLGPLDQGEVVIVYKLHYEDEYRFWAGKSSEEYLPYAILSKNLCFWGETWSFAYSINMGEISPLSEEDALIYEL